MQKVATKSQWSRKCRFVFFSTSDYKVKDILKSFFEVVKDKFTPHISNRNRRKMLKLTIYSYHSNLILDNYTIVIALATSRAV